MLCSAANRHTDAQQRYITELFLPPVQSSVHLKTGQTQYDGSLLAQCLSLILNAAFFPSSPLTLWTNKVKHSRWEHL